METIFSHSLVWTFYFYTIFKKPLQKQYLKEAVRLGIQIKIFSFGETSMFVVLLDE